MEYTFIATRPSWISSLVMSLIVGLARWDGRCLDGGLIGGSGWALNDSTVAPAEPKKAPDQSQELEKDRNYLRMESFF